MSSGAPLTHDVHVRSQTFCTVPAVVTRQQHDMKAGPTAFRPGPAQIIKWLKIQSAIYDAIHWRPEQVAARKALPIRRRTTPLVQPNPSCSGYRPRRSRGAYRRKYGISRSVYGAPDKKWFTVLTSYGRFHRLHIVAIPFEARSPSIAAVPSRSVYPTVRRFRIRSP